MNFPDTFNLLLQLKPLFFCDTGSSLFSKKCSARSHLCGCLLPLPAQALKLDRGYWVDRGGLDLGLLAFLLALLPSLPPLVHDPVVRDPRKCPTTEDCGSWGQCLPWGGERGQHLPFIICCYQSSFASKCGGAAWGGRVSGAEHTHFCPEDSESVQPDIIQPFPVSSRLPQFCICLKQEVHHDSPFPLSIFY